MATVGVLSIFLALTIAGITESATVAIGIFLLHLTSMAVLLAAGLLLFSEGTSVAMANFQAPLRRGFQWCSSSGSARPCSASPASRARPASWRSSSLGCSQNAAEHVDGREHHQPAHGLMAVLVIPGAGAGTTRRRCSPSWANAQAVPGSAPDLHRCHPGALRAVLTSFVGVSGLIRRMTWTASCRSSC